MSAGNRSLRGLFLMSLKTPCLSEWLKIAFFSLSSWISETVSVRKGLFARFLVAPNTFEYYSPATSRDKSDSCVWNESTSRSRSLSKVSSLPLALNLLPPLCRPAPNRWSLSALSLNLLPCPDSLTALPLFILVVCFSLIIVNF